MSIIGFSVVPFVVLLALTMLVNAREDLARERNWLGPILVGFFGALLSYALSFAVSGAGLAALSPIVVPAIVAGILGEILAPKYLAGSFAVGSSVSFGVVAIGAALAFTGQFPDGALARVSPSEFFALVIIPGFIAAAVTGFLRALRGRRYHGAAR